jgi:hypothetical protein|tara:strand:- start:338 stop:790 length:453 start_codon:yes stop_codon:yes gene_type:complete
MAKYITPALTLTSNSHDATTNPGPTSSPLNISVSDLIDVTEVRSFVIDVSTTNVQLIDASEIASSVAAGTDGGFLYLRNLTEGLATTADIYIGHGTDGALEGTTTTRLMTLKPGEFSFFGYDLEADLIVDASASVVGALEAMYFVRTGTA